MCIERLSDILFYTLENTIKGYRQFAQRNISEAKFDITIDQWLILKTLQENTSITQQKLAGQVFKDYASITRIIDLLVKKGYLKRTSHKTDRRRFELTITKEGINTIESIEPIIHNNRAMALKGISKAEIVQLQLILNKIISNTP
jgi:MarR family transcriptional regulator, transcriptional regulator for hemolysin